MSKEVVTGSPTPVTVAGYKPVRPSGGNSGTQQTTTTTSTSIPTSTSTTSTTLPVTPGDSATDGGSTNSTILWLLLAVSVCGFFLFVFVRRHRKGEDL